MPTKPGPVTGTDQAHEVDATWLPKSRMAPTQRVSFHSQEISNLSNRLRRHVGTIYQMIIYYIYIYMTPKHGATRIPGESTKAQPRGGELRSETCCLDEMALAPTPYAYPPNVLG